MLMGCFHGGVDFFFQESVHDEKGNEVHEQTRERYLERIAD